MCFFIVTFSELVQIFETSQWFNFPLLVVDDRFKNVMLAVCFACMRLREKVTQTEKDCDSWGFP